MYGRNYDHQKAVLNVTKVTVVKTMNNYETAFKQINHIDNLK